MCTRAVPDRSGAGRSSRLRRAVGARRRGARRPSAVLSKAKAAMNCEAPRIPASSTRASSARFLPWTEALVHGGQGEASRRLVPDRVRRAGPAVHAADGQAVRWPVGRTAVRERTHAPQPSELLSMGRRHSPWLSPGLLVSGGESLPIIVRSIRSPLSSRRLHSPSFPVRAPAPGARTLRRQAARRGRPQARRCGGERSAAFSRFAPGGLAPRMDHRLSEAPPRLWPSVRGGWHRAAGPRPRRACSRAALAPQRWRTGGVARAALVAAPRLRRLKARPSLRVRAGSGEARGAPAAAGRPCRQRGAADAPDWTSRDRLRV